MGHPDRSVSSEPSPSDASPPASPETEPAEVPGAARRSLLFQETTPPPESPDLGTSSPLHPSSGALDASPSSPGAGGSASAPRSTGKARLRELREMARAAVATAGGIAHRFLTREDSPEREVGLFVPDDDDVKAIGDPLASLASRRMPEGAGNPDTVDIVRAVLGLVTYATKQLEKKAWAAQARVQRDPFGPDWVPEAERDEQPAGE